MSERRGELATRVGPAVSSQRPRLVRRALAGLTVAALVALTAVVGVSASPAAAAATASGVTVTLDSISPRTPDATKPTQKITITATVTNDSTVTYTGLSVHLERGQPITTRQGLTAALATPPPSDTVSTGSEPVAGSLAPGASTTVVFHTTPDVNNPLDPTNTNMCLCQAAAVEPYALVVDATSGVTTGEIGRTQVLVPSFNPSLLDPGQAQPGQVKVAWVWPLVDRPHRSLSETVFTDDDLAASVAPGGRLFRALQVAIGAASRHLPMTVMIDPDLIDSLVVMSGAYQVRAAGTARTVAGTGQQVARNWLAGFETVAATEQVALTAFADPDVNAQTRAGIAYSAALDPQVARHVASVIKPGSYTTGFLWPAGGALTTKALDAAVTGGISTILLGDQALPTSDSATAVPNAIAALGALTGTATALVTDSAISTEINAALQLGSTPATAQQDLIAQLAMRAISRPGVSRFVVMAPGRYVDTDPQAALATIAATESAPWTSGISLTAAQAQFSPADHGPLQTSVENPAAEVESGAMAALKRVTAKVGSLRDAFSADSTGSSAATATTLLAGYNLAVLRAQSSYWRNQRAAGRVVADDLERQVDTLLDSVSLVTPAVGSYSLSSTSSPIAVTVENRLPIGITVQVGVHSSDSSAGFHADTLTSVLIAAGSKRTLQVPAHLKRLGTFAVTATMSTPDGQQLGHDVALSVHSTAIGGITRIVTIGAGVVLGLALLRRLIMRIRRKPGATPPHPTPMTASV